MVDLRKRNVIKKKKRNEEKEERNTEIKEEERKQAEFGLEKVYHLVKEST